MTLGNLRLYDRPFGRFDTRFELTYRFRWCSARFPLVGHETAAWCLARIYLHCRDHPDAQLVDAKSTDPYDAHVSSPLLPLLTLLLVLGGAIAFAAAMTGKPIRVGSMRLAGLDGRVQRAVIGFIGAVCLAAAFMVGSTGLVADAAAVSPAPAASASSPMPAGPVVDAGQVPSPSSSVPVTTPAAKPSARPDTVATSAGTPAAIPTSRAASRTKTPATTTTTTTTTKTTTAARPTLAVGATRGSQDYTGPCDSQTSVTFNGTVYLGPSTLMASADIHWTFSVTAGGTGTDSGTETALVLPDRMAATALMFETIKLPNTAPGKYSITGRYTASSPDTLPASPSAASITIHVTCT